MKAVKIKGNDDKVLSVELKDVIMCIENGSQTNWGLLWIEAVAELDDGQSIVAFEHRVNQSAKATIFSWAELLKLSTQIIQTKEILFIGAVKKSNIKRYDSDGLMYVSCNYTVELLDSSYWEVHSDDDAFIRNLYNKLPGVEEILDCK